MALRLGASRGLGTQLSKAWRHEPLHVAHASAACRKCAAFAEKKESMIQQIWSGTSPRFLTKDAITLSAEEANGFNRWSVFPRVFLIQIPTGAVYAWSMWQGPLTSSLGVLAPAALDWSLGSVAATFSCLAVGFGTVVGGLGPWIERAGPRYAALVGGLLFGGGHVLSAVGCYTHTLPLIWLGWGVLGGLGWGMGYIAPIGALLRWFPDKRGLATGMAAGAFASGGFLAAPMIEALRGMYFKAPTFAGALATTASKTEGGKQFVLYNNEWHEAIVAKAADIAKAPGDVASQLVEGFYLVGTGDTGCMLAFASLGAIYTGTMSLGSCFMRLPPAGWTPAGWTPSPAGASSVAAAGSVTPAMAMRTPQFYLLWLTLAGNASAGVCVIASAKVMMGDIFASLNPAIVTTGFTTGFVSALSVANAGGRVAWASVSDVIGRKNTMFICSMALPACMLIPQITQVAVAGSTGTLPLYMFYGTTFAIVTWYGGVLALMPSYTADLFGAKYAPVIFGRLLTGWSVSAIVSPSILTSLRGHSTRNAIESLVAVTTPEAFEQSFKAPVSELPELMEAKTVTIARMMEIVPPGTVDPTPFLYDTTFYSIGGILTTAAVSNALIRKVDPKFFEEIPQAPRATKASREDDKEK